MSKQGESTQAFNHWCAMVGIRSNQYKREVFPVWKAGVRWGRRRPDLQEQFTILQQACSERNKLWDPSAQLGPQYRALELGGEAGEVLNVVKKLERERLNLPGSRTTVEFLAQELADVVICAQNLANQYGIDLWAATRGKFNDTSRAVGLPVYILGEDTEEEDGGD